MDLSVHQGRVAIADWRSLRVYDGTTKTPTLLAAERTGEEMGRALAVSFRKDVIFVGDWTGVHMYAPLLNTRTGHLAFDRGTGHLVPDKDSSPPNHSTEIKRSKRSY